VDLQRFDGQYSERLGFLTGAQLQAALDRFDLGELLEAEPARRGIFGQNVLLRTSKGDYVLRGKPHYDWQFSKERFFAGLILAHTPVRAPWPFLIAPEHDIFGWSYALLPRLPGYQMASPSSREGLTADEEIAVARALGRGLAALQELTWPYCGKYDFAHEAIARNAFDHRETALGELNDFLGRCVRADRLTELDYAWIREVIRDNEQALTEPVTPTVIHHDFTEGNAVFARLGPDWQLTGVFDLMEAYFGDPEEDLARPVFNLMDRDSELAVEFIGNYAANRPTREGAAERFRIYMLRDCLLMWWFGHQPGRWLEGQAGFRQWAKPYVTLDPFN
jgi:hygromycin-B 7''-O-kinase